MQEHKVGAFIVESGSSLEYFTRIKWWRSERTDEPGLYAPGEFGIRPEDCWHMTAAGPKLFTGLAKSIDQPI